MTFYSSITFASPHAEEILQQLELTDIDAVFANAGDAFYRHHARCVYELKLPETALLQKEQTAGSRLFVKLNWGRRRLCPRMTDIKTGQLFQSLPVREWNGIATFAAIGLNVPERLCLLRSGFWTFRDAVILREVLPPYSVDEMLQNGQWELLSSEEQSSLLAAIVETLGRIHAAKLGWRGASSRHFYPLREPDGRWKIWLIDCEGVHRCWSPKIITRDKKKLWRALQESGANPETLNELAARLEITMK